MPDTFKQAGLFLIKAISFTLVFWCVWLFVVRPITTAQNNNSAACTQDASAAGQDAAMEKYMAQAAKADEQQRRMDSILTKKEEQDRRFDALLSTWEKQAKIAK